MSNPRVKTTCPVCNETSLMPISNGQAFGLLATGMGECPKCKTFLALKLLPSRDEMVATEWGKYVDSLRKR